jgi:lipopolysaccharide transport system ATP-binding protein
MEEVSEHGRTVLFVSHNMETISRLCNKAILLNAGTIQAAGNTDEVIKKYLHSDFGTSAQRKWTGMARPGNDIVRLMEVRVHNKNNEVKESYDITQPVGITMDYEVLTDGDSFTHSFNFYNEEGSNIFNTHDTVSELNNKPHEKGIYTVTMWIPGNLLAEGIVLVGAAVIKISPFEIYFHELNAVSFNVIDYMRGDSARGNYVLGFPGMVRPLLEWHNLKK